LPSLPFFPLPDALWRFPHFVEIHYGSSREATLSNVCPNSVSQFAAARKAMADEEKERADKPKRRAERLIKGTGKEIVYVETGMRIVSCRTDSRHQSSHPVWLADPSLRERIQQKLNLVPCYDSEIPVPGKALPTPQGKKRSALDWAPVDSAGESNKVLQPFDVTTMDFSFSTRDPREE
jgi:hypothetical protein